MQELVIYYIIQNKNILIVLYDLFLRKIIIKCEAQSTVTGLQLKSCVAGPDSDPKDPHNFGGSGSIIFSKDLDPNPNPDPNSDLEIAHFPHPFSHQVSLSVPRLVN